MGKNSIEETKRIIEKLISAMKSDRELFTEKTDKEIYTFFINALEFILSDYNRVLKENELYRTEVNCTEQLKKENEELKNKIMEKGLEIIGKEEEIKADMREIIEQYYTANEDCISKQKIKDKIKELEKERKKMGNDVVEIYEKDLVDVDIEFLQELIKEREEK